MGIRLLSLSTVHVDFNFGHLALHIRVMPLGKLRIWLRLIFRGHVICFRLKKFDINSNISWQNDTVLTQALLFIFTLLPAFYFLYWQQQCNGLLRLRAASTTEFATGHQCWCTLPMEGVPVVIVRSNAERLMDQERSCQNIFCFYTSLVAFAHIFKVYSDRHDVQIAAALHK
jgi:hypothetical protein